MKKAFSIIILLAFLWVMGDLARTIWLGKGEAPSETFQLLVTPMTIPVENSKTNGYFMLLGIAAAPTEDPLHVGQEMWVEAQSDRGHRLLDYSKGQRLALRVPEDVVEALRPGRMQGGLAQLRAKDNPALNLLAPHAALLDRYRQWVTLPFDDGSNGIPGTPRLTDIYAAHRLYLLEAWAQSTGVGIERLAADLPAWRGVLANAKGLPLKVFAAAVVEEDLALLADALVTLDLDVDIVRRLEPLIRPLTAAERSLQWPMQSEFAVGVALFELPLTGASARFQAETESQKRWLARLAGLNASAFHSVEQPIPDNMLSRAPMQKQRALNIYAAYTAATIKAAEVPNSPFPKLLDMARVTHNRFLDYFTNPIDNVFASGPEPNWAPFVDRTFRTDARMRLVALAARLRRTGTAPTVPMRTVQAGYSYYDPFSGLPMLWAPATGRLYSVGEDRKDDGGDDERDIAVQIYRTLE